MRKIFVRPRASRGQSIVEFAFVSLIILLLTFGTIDLGRGVYQRSLLTNAAREGGRYGAVGDRSDVDPASTTGYRAKIAEAAAGRSPSLNLTAANVATVGCNNWSRPSGETGALGDCGLSDTTAEVGDRLTVCITYTFGLTAPRLIGFTSIPMTECARGALQ